VKKVVFKTLKVKNFLSIGKTIVSVDFQKGLNIITGINKDLMDRQNGTGKSSLVDSFYFALFGETTRGIKKEFVVNNLTNESAEVSLTFSIDENEYEIIRTIKPSKLNLFENGVDISRDSMANTTEYILNILNLTPEIFTNCICLSINSTVPFMAQKNLEKKKFIEGIFNLDVFSKMNSGLKEEYGEVKKEIERKSEKYDDLEKTVKLVLDQNKRNSEEREKRRNQIEENISKLEKQIQVTSDNISKYVIDDVSQNKVKIKKLEEKKKSKNDEIQQIFKQKTEISTEIKILKNDLLKIGTDQDECPICLRAITDGDLEHIDDRKKTIQRDIEEKSNIIVDFSKKQNDLESEVTLMDKAINLLKDSVNKNSLLEQQKNNDEEKVQYFNSQLSKERNALNDLQNYKEEEAKSVEEIQIQIQEISNELQELKKRFKVLENVKFVLSEEGVKSYVVKKILALFNAKIAFYLKELNANSSITFDQYFEEDIKNERGKLTTYFNYSGAERKAIDLSIMFAFIDMLKLQTNVYYNVQFYDELLDTSLDSAGVENVVRILNEFVDKYSYGIYVISHRRECSKLANGEVVYLEKSNGITKRIPLDLELK
jgi:DNA repair exonuclease SbcCD ATPase subunit